jgi:anti-anti-sigma factor
MTQLEATNGIVVIRVRGHLNAKTAPDLLQRCRDVLESGKNLVLNFSEVSFITSSGIGGLLAIVEEFRGKGLSVRFAALSSVVESVIKLLRLDKFLGIDGTEDEAVSALGA